MEGLGGGGWGFTCICGFILAYPVLSVLDQSNTCSKELYRRRTRSISASAAYS